MPGGVGGDPEPIVERLNHPIQGLFGRRAVRRLFRASAAKKVAIEPILAIRADSAELLMEKADLGFQKPRRHAAHRKEFGEPPHLIQKGFHV